MNIIFIDESDKIESTDEQFPFRSNLTLDFLSIRREFDSVGFRVIKVTKKKKKKEIAPNSSIDARESDREN